MTDYMARIGRENGSRANEKAVEALFGPGLAEAEKSGMVWPSVNIMHTGRIEVLMRPDITLTRDMKVAIKEINRKSGADFLALKPYDERNIGNLLAERSDGVKRIIIPDSDSAEMIDRLLNEEEALFNDARLLNFQFTEDCESMNADAKTVRLARLFMVAVLARLAEMDSTEAVNALLKYMLAPYFKSAGVNSSDFIFWLTDRSFAAKRIRYFLGNVIRWSEEAGRQLRFVKEFWTYA